ncbi:hypothetical protein ACFU5N_27635 [Streptomyces albidoflavus]
MPVDVLVDIGGGGEEEGRGKCTTSLLDTPCLVGEWGLPSAIVLLSGGGHAWIGLEYRGCGADGDPSVPWFGTELDSELSLASDFVTLVESVTAGDFFDLGPSGRSTGRPAS